MATPCAASSSRYPRLHGIRQRDDHGRPPARGWKYTRAFLVALIAVSLAGCSTAQRNVAVYLLADASGALQPADPTVTGLISGTVRSAQPPHTDAALRETVVVVADRIGTPYSGVTDARGHYQIEAPLGEYVISGVTTGYAEGQTVDTTGRPQTVTVTEGGAVAAPPLVLTPLHTPPFPPNLADAMMLTQTGAYTTTSAFPQGSAAHVQAFQFTRNGVANDTLRVYTPLDADDATSLPLLLAVYPGTVDGWEPVSISLAAQGYALVAVSPLGVWELDVEQHAADARTALALAQQGALGPQIDASRPIALGGSFSSAILYRVLRQMPDTFGGWVTVGGIADAFSGAAAFYNGAIAVPDAYRFAIPALGNPSLNPVAFLEYSPLYGVRALPPTLIIHTAADEIIPIEQAYALEDALREIDTPVETFFYEDVSHYLQIEEEMTDAGREMFFRVLDFIERYGT